MKGSFQTKAFFCLLQNNYNTGWMQGLWTQAGKWINQGIRLWQVTSMQVTAHRDPRIRAHTSQSSADPSTGFGTGTSDHQQPSGKAREGCELPCQGGLAAQCYWKTQKFLQHECKLWLLFRGQNINPVWKQWQLSIFVIFYKDTDFISAVYWNLIGFFCLQNMASNGSLYQMR